MFLSRGVLIGKCFLGLKTHRSKEHSHTEMQNEKSRKMTVIIRPIKSFPCCCGMHAATAASPRNDTVGESHANAQHMSFEAFGNEYT